MKIFGGRTRCKLKARELLLHCTKCILISLVLEVHGGFISTYLLSLEWQFGNGLVLKLYAHYLELGSERGGSQGWPLGWSLQDARME